MIVSDFIVQNLVHVAAIFTLVCFLFRDQIKLRLFASLGDALLSAYYYLAFAEPLWNPLYWSVANVVINLFMIGILLREHRMSLLSDNELRLFRCLETLTPGQFRKLLKLATWHEDAEPVQLTAEGEVPERLFFVLDGKVKIGKQERVLEREPKLFIGEIAFLRDKAATATVSTLANSLYVSWEQAQLRNLLKKNEDLKNAMGALLSADMADKVANS
jgi:Cyclic nucleotide-binding domain